MLSLLGEIIQALSLHLSLETLSSRVLGRVLRYLDAILDLLLQVGGNLLASDVLTLCCYDVDVELSLASSRLSLSSFTHLPIQSQRLSLVCQVVPLDSLALESLELVSRWSVWIDLFFLVWPISNW